MALLSGSVCFSHLVIPLCIVKLDLLRVCFPNQTPCNREGTFHSWNGIDFLYTKLGAWNKKNTLLI